MSAAKRPRLSEPALRVLRVMLTEPSESFYGLDLIGRCGVKSGTLYPLLARLADAGWLEATKEDVDAGSAGRPVRTYYRLTGLGEREARAALVALAPQSGLRWALS